MKHAGMALFAVLLIWPVSGIAGGLFGDGGLSSGEVGTFLKKRVAPPANAKPEQKDLNNLQYFDQIIGNRNNSAASAVRSRGANGITGRAAPVSELSPYEELVSKKTAEQRTYEEKLEGLLGMPVSNICLTATAACEVDYTTTGSSCFCAGSKSVELGIVK